MASRHENGKMSLNFPKLSQIPTKFYEAAASMNNSEAENNPGTISATERLQAARLNKLRKIEERGIDPWGGYFPNRTLIQAVRGQCTEIKYRLASGNEIALPDLESDNPVDYANGKRSKALVKKLAPRYVWRDASC